MVIAWQNTGDMKMKKVYEFIHTTKPLWVLLFVLVLILTSCKHTTTPPPATITATTTKEIITITTTNVTPTSTQTTSTASTSPTASVTITTTGTTTPTTTLPSTISGEIEATEFLGTKLTPISQQQNNALAGTQHIDRSTYVLTVDGLVDNPLELTYADLQSLPQISKLMPLNCVEGWNFTAKWTGPALAAIFAEAKVQPSAKIAIFYTADVPTGYSSLDLSYISDRNIIIALKLNDITLPEDRGFPFQVVAESKYGYKWAKWITRIELSDNVNFRGFWESAGYNNNADVGGPAFETGP